MQRKMNKKGFTIVELVIVIVVIAILAAVLIPTFVSLTKKANLSSDQQAVRQMNMLLTAEMVDDEDPTLAKALEVLDEAGYKADSLTPVTKNHYFYWYKTYNIIILVDAENAEEPVLVYPTDDKYAATFADDIKNDTICFNLENAEAKYVDVNATDVDSLKQAFAAGTKKIKLDADVTMNKVTTVPAGAEIVVDLGGKTLTTAERDSNGSHHYAFDIEGTVTFTNGTIDARGVQVYNGAKLIVGEGATINAVDDNGGACIWMYEGSEIIIDGGTFKAMNGDCDDVNDAAGNREPGIINNNKGKIVINAGTFEAKSNCYAVINNGGEIIINGGTFKASRGVVAADTGNVEINGGTFETAADAKAWLVYANNGNVVINGGTFTGVQTFTVESAGSGKITVNPGVVVNGVTVSAKTVYPQG